MSTALAVDDFEPFRRLVCSALKNAPDLQVIGEASDGLATNTSPLALSKMMPSASGCAATVPSTAFVSRSKITTAPLPSLMNPRPASGTKATPWLCFWPGISASVFPESASTVPLFAFHSYCLD
jgi:hypothetical protein